MAGSGLEELMKAAYGGVMKMLTGKNFPPKNTRALRIVVKQVLHQILCEVNTVDELMQKLKASASKRRTAKHWVENLVLPVLLMLIFIRAERDGKWVLHLWAVNEMIIFFCCWAHSLCKIWPNLPQINAKAAWGNPRKISEGRTCPTPQTRTVEWDMDRHVHRDNDYALWAQARWSHWNNTEWDSCP